MKRNNKFLILLLVIALFSVFMVVTLKSRRQFNKDTTPQQNSEDQLIGKWEVVSVEENGTEIVSEINNASLIFSVDGTCSAIGGCNEMMNCQYEILPNSKISISIGGTKKSCSQDIVEYWDLNDITSYDFTDHNLSLHYEKESGVKGSFILIKLSQ